MKETVVIVDDHPLFSRGLSQLIETNNVCKVVGLAKNKSEALDIITKFKPRLTIVDLNLGQEDGLELIKDILMLRPTTKVLVLSMHDERFYAERAISAGAKGYIMKEEAESQVINAITTVLNGEIYLSERELLRLNQKKDAETSVKSEEDSLKNAPEKESLGGLKTNLVHSLSVLSDRQLQIFTLMGKGFGTAEIAKKLNLAPKTIDTHKENLKAKLHCKNTTELRQMAIVWKEQSD